MVAIAIDYQNFIVSSQYEFHLVCIILIIWTSGDISEATFTTEADLGVHAPLVR